MKVLFVFCSIQRFFFLLMFLFLKVFLVLVQGTSLIQRLMSVAYTYDNLAPRYAFYVFICMYMQLLNFIFALVLVAHTFEYSGGRIRWIPMYWSTY